MIYIKQMYCSIFYNGLSIYNLYGLRGVSMSKEHLIIKKRGEDGNRIISVRIKEDILKELDRIAGESNYSRNELINIILDYGVHNIEIE